MYISVYEHDRFFRKPPLLGPTLSYAKDLMLIVNTHGVFGPVRKVQY